MNRIKNELYKKWMYTKIMYKKWNYKNERIKNERIKNELIKKELIPSSWVCAMPNYIIHSCLTPRLKWITALTNRKRDIFWNWVEVEIKYTDSFLAQTFSNFQNMCLVAEFPTILFLTSLSSVLFGDLINILHTRDFLKEYLQCFRHLSIYNT